MAGTQQSGVVIHTLDSEASVFARQREQPLAQAQRRHFQSRNKCTGRGQTKSLFFYISLFPTLSTENTHSSQLHLLRFLCTSEQEAGAMGAAP
jgi:hypothetical protein